MNFLKTIVIGMVIWGLMFVLVFAFLDFYQRLVWVKVVMAVVAGVLSLILAGAVRPKGTVGALSYGFVWVLVGLLLDYLVTKRYNAEFFGQWSLWLGYVLVLLAPILRIRKSASSNI